MANDVLEAWLRGFIADNGAVAGTVHLRDGDTLLLGAAVNIPPKVIEIVQVVPKGKGMAGLALQRDEVVSTCNLKTDETGDVRPGAKAVDANAAVADSGSRMALVEYEGWWGGSRSRANAILVSRRWRSLKRRAELLPV
jgi:hypothetical protein